MFQNLEERLILTYYKPISKILKIYIHIFTKYRDYINNAIFGSYFTTRALQGARPKGGVARHSLQGAPAKPCLNLGRST